MKRRCQVVIIWDEYLSRVIHSVKTGLRSSLQKQLLPDQLQNLGGRLRSVDRPCAEFRSTSNLKLAVGIAALPDGYAGAGMELVSAPA
jgi:hypothetical protein